jgi:hypothetical protein
MSDQEYCFKELTKLTPTILLKNSPKDCAQWDECFLSWCRRVYVPWSGSPEELEGLERMTTEWIETRPDAGDIWKWLVGKGYAERIKPPKNWNQLFVKKQSQGTVAFCDRASSKTLLVFLKDGTIHRVSNAQGGHGFFDNEGRLIIS